MRDSYSYTTEIRGAIHAWLGTLAYSSTKGVGAMLSSSECAELHKLLMLLDGPSREEIIEECARVADKVWVETNSLLGSKIAHQIANGIRDLNTSIATTNGPLNKEGGN